MLNFRIHSKCLNVVSYQVVSYQEFPEKLRFQFDRKVNLKLELHFLLFMCWPLIHVYRVTSICMRLHVNINNRWLIWDQEIFFIDTIYNSLIGICLRKIYRKRNIDTKKQVQVPLDWTSSAEKQRRILPLKIAAGHKPAAIGLQTRLPPRLLSSQLIISTTKIRRRKEVLSFVMITCCKDIFTGGFWIKK